MRNYAVKPSKPTRWFRWMMGLLVLWGIVFWFVWRSSGPNPESPASTAVLLPRNGQPEAGASPRPNVASRIAQQPAPLVSAPRLQTRWQVNYGDGVDELGVIHAPEMAPIGPESFALTPDGCVCVGDPVNQRIQVYAADGTHLRAVPSPGISVNDVMTDAQGRLYVFDQAEHLLHQFAADGTPASTLHLDPADLDTRGYFHLVGNAVYFADAAVRDVLVARIQDGQLIRPETATARRTEGIHAESGRIYAVSVVREQELGLQIHDPTDRSAEHRLSVALPCVVAAGFIGEDQSRRFYLWTERWQEERVVMEVLTFDAAGEVLGAFRLPENDYYLWTTQPMAVAADGTLVQFLPQRGQASLSMFAKETR